MFFSTLITAAAFAATAFSSPISVARSVHEKRTQLPDGWTKRSVLDRRAILPMKIALAQGNLENGPEWLEAVSDPDSEKYGHHWTADEVAEAFAPSKETVDIVTAWLAAAGISTDRISQGASLGFLEFDATVDEAEGLLGAKYNVYEHENGMPHVACEEYSIPTHLTEHIDFVYPTVHFDAQTKRVEKRSEEKRAVGPTTDVGTSVGLPNSGSLPKQGAAVPDAAVGKAGLANCDVQITPDCLRALYQFPKGSSANPQNSYGIVEYTPQAYVPSDLDKFFGVFNPPAVGERPILDSIDGGVVQQVNQSFGYNGESDLDLEYAMTLVYPQQVTLYQVGDLVEGASFNNFLDAIDGSYCTFRGGDSPIFDAPYPDPNPGGYKSKDCGKYAATRVISTSYGYNEHDLTPFYERRQCAEYMKLGLMGVSVLYSSGDYGVAGNLGQCIAGPGPNAPYNNGHRGRFNPAFPSTCPYVTSVGATQVIPGADVTSTTTEPEEACETVIFSGGGFSNVFPLPSYQAGAVANYYANYAPPYGPNRYNNSQQVRGYPDISANGANYVVAVDGTFSLVYGTSASSPTLGSILTLINEQRYNNGQSSIGFINPVAYKNPQVFNDITLGNNPGCGTNGFSAVPGWDPVTGLGTPNYPKMLKLFLSLGGGYGWSPGQYGSFKA